MSLNRLYQVIGISKQAFHQHLARRLQSERTRLELLGLIHQIRNDHPSMGVREIYYKLQPAGIGRDAFEAFCKDESLNVKPVKNWRRTTESSGTIRFDNLLEGLEVKRLNQVWQSDITYFEVAGKFCFITFIIDGFSRRIVGHHTSERLLTGHTTLPALQMALKLRKKEDITALIFHSDGGGQYYDKCFVKLTKSHKIRNSMCEYAWENGKAERINGTIKNGYLRHRKINSFSELRKEVDRSVQLYNMDKPHKALKRLTPIKFENDLYLKSKQKLYHQNS